MGESRPEYLSGMKKTNFMEFWLLKAFFGLWALFLAFEQSKIWPSRVLSSSWL